MTAKGGQLGIAIAIFGRRSSKAHRPNGTAHLTIQRDIARRGRPEKIAYRKSSSSGLPSQWQLYTIPVSGIQFGGLLDIRSGLGQCGGTSLDVASQNMTNRMDRTSVRGPDEQPGKNPHAHEIYPAGHHDLLGGPASSFSAPGTLNESPLPRKLHEYHPSPETPTTTKGWRRSPL